MTNSTIKYFMYLRKSTDDLSRQIRSIGDQKAELRELVRRHDLDVAEVFIEKQSAKRPGRPVFDDMLRRMEKGEAQGILAWHPDRLARNSLDGGRIIYYLDTGVIKDLKFANCSFENTAAGKLNLSMMFSMSKHYVDNLSENIKRGIRQKVKNGLWPGCAPVGYLNDRLTRTIVIDPERGPIVKLAFEMFATGNYTLAQVHKKVSATGLVGIRGGRLSKSNIHRLLQNPIYCGLILHKDELHEAKHDPLITKQLFDRVQEVMRQKSRPKTRATQRYLYKGLLHCGECGCMVTNERQKGHVYLRCTKKRGPCSQRYLREEEMTRQVESFLRSIALLSEDADWMLQELHTRQDKEQAAADTVGQRVRTDLASIDRKIKLLHDAYLDEAVSPEELRSTKSGLVQERQALKERLAAIESTDGAHRLEPVVRFVKASRATGFVASGDESEKKRDWLQTIGSNRRLHDGRLVLVPRGAWKLVATSALQATTPEPGLRRVRVFSPEPLTLNFKRRGWDSNPR